MQRRAQQAQSTEQAHAQALTLKAVGSPCLDIHNPCSQPWHRFCRHPTNFINWQLPQPQLPPWALTLIADAMDGTCCTHPRRISAITSSGVRTRPLSAPSPSAAVSPPPTTDRAVPGAAAAVAAVTAANGNEGTPPARVPGMPPCSGWYGTEEPAAPFAPAPAAAAAAGGSGSGGAARLALLAAVSACRTLESRPYTMRMCCRTMSGLQLGTAAVRAEDSREGGT